MRPSRAAIAILCCSACGVIDAVPNAQTHRSPKPAKINSHLQGLHAGHAGCQGTELSGQAGQVCRKWRPRGRPATPAVRLAACGSGRRRRTVRQCGSYLSNQEMQLDWMQRPQTAVFGAVVQLDWTRRPQTAVFRAVVVASTKLHKARTDKGCEKLPLTGLTEIRAQSAWTNLFSQHVSTTRISGVGLQNNSTCDCSSASCDASCCSRCSRCAGGSADSAAWYAIWSGSWKGAYPFCAPRATELMSIATAMMLLSPVSPTASQTCCQLPAAPPSRSDCG